MKQKSITIYLLLFFIFLKSSLLLAQPNRYWSNSFNTDASLLSGAVVGGGSGITAIYYNPAQIADISYKKFAITANIFSFYNTNFQNAIQDGSSTSDLKFRVQPRFVAYLLRPNKWKNTSIEIATFTRNSYKLEQRERVMLETDVIKSYPGNEQYIGDFYYRNEYYDYWIGGGIAHEISSKWKIGISGFYSYSSLKYNYQISTQAISISDPQAEVVQYSNGQYIYGFTNSLLFKAGTTFSSNNWQFGVAITTPTLRINGSSEISREVTTNNIHDENANVLTDVVITDYKSELPTNFNLPLSISFGISRTFMKHSVYLSTQYFGALENFNMIENTSESAFVSGNLIDVDKTNWLSIQKSAKEVTNVAFGWRGNMNDHLELMGGFRTDFSYHLYDGVDDYESPASLVVPSIDQFHITSGVQFELLHSDIILGLQYSFSARKSLEQLANFSAPIEYDPVKPTILQGYRNDTMKIRENTLSIFFGFTYNINEIMSD